MREFTSSIIDLSPLEAFADKVYYMRLDCLQPVYHAPCNLAG